jgi:hypothetical protein
MNKVIMLILETCTLKQLAEIMIEYAKRFEDSLKSPFKNAREANDDPSKFYNLVKEK